MFGLIQSIHSHMNEDTISENFCVTVVVLLCSVTSVARLGAYSCVYHVASDEMVMSVPDNCSL